MLGNMGGPHSYFELRKFNNNLLRSIGSSKSLQPTTIPIISPIAKPSESWSVFAPSLSRREKSKFRRIKIFCKRARRRD